MITLLTLSILCVVGVALVSVALLLIGLGRRRHEER